MTSSDIPPCQCPLVGEGLGPPGLMLCPSQGINSLGAFLFPRGGFSFLLVKQGLGSKSHILIMSLNIIK